MRATAIEPAWAVPGARVTLRGDNLPRLPDAPPEVIVGKSPARVVSAARDTIEFTVPDDCEGGTQAVRLPASGLTATLEVGRVLTTGVHQVDDPAFDDDGRLYATQSGGRDTKVTVPLYRIGRDGVREPIAVEVGNPTSLAFGPDGSLYVSSRFDGVVYRLGSGDRVERFASELGVPTGLAFRGDGTLFVGDRSGSVFKISPDRHVETFATLPASVAAYHLAFGPDDALYVTAPTLATHDGIHRIAPDGTVGPPIGWFGRPQGLAFERGGLLYIADALAGAAGVYSLDVRRAGAAPQFLVSTPAVVGLAFDPAGGLIVASNDTIWRLDLDLHPWRTPRSRQPV